MDIRKLFDDKSEIYARARPRYPVALYEWLATVSTAHRSAWDVGCGSGQAAADLSSYFETVEATDVSASQIASAPSMERVRFSVQPAESTNFSDDSFDAVCVAQALHWFDYNQFWPEVKRVLRPNGVFAAWGYNWPHIDPQIDAVLQRGFLTAIEPFWDRRNKLLWDGYRDVPFPLERVEVPSFELTMQWTIERLFAYLHSWSATRRCMEAEGGNFFESSFKTVSDLWGSATERQVAMDFIAIAGRNAA